MDHSWGIKETEQNKGLSRDYVKKFSFLIFKIKNILEEDYVFNFFDGIDKWPKAGVQIAKLKDLASAIAIANSLVDKIGAKCWWV